MPIHRPLNKPEWLKEIPAEAEQLLLAIASARSLRDGELLFAKGDAPTGLFRVVRGRVRISITSATGKEQLSRIYEPGGWFGEISMFDNQPRTHDAHALGETEVRMVPQARLLDLLGQQPQLYPHFLRMLCRKLREAFIFVERSQQSLPVRLAACLLDLAAIYGEDTADGLHINAHLTQEELSHMLLVTRQSVSTELKVWQMRGWVQVDYGRIIICDTRALEDLLKPPKPAG